MGFFPQFIFHHSHQVLEKEILKPLKNMQACEEKMEFLIIVTIRMTIFLPSANHRSRNPFRKRKSYTVKALLEGDTVDKEHHH